MYTNVAVELITGNGRASTERGGQNGVGRWRKVVVCVRFPRCIIFE